MAHCCAQLAIMITAKPTGKVLSGILLDKEDFECPWVRNLERLLVEIAMAAVKEEMEMLRHWVPQTYFTTTI